MNSIKTYLASLGRATRTVILALAVVFVGAGIAQASTTIGTNVSTAGTLGVTGLSSLAFASSTLLSANSAYFGATATSTFDTAGNLSVIGTLGVTGTLTASGLVKIAPAYSIDTSSGGVLNIGTTTATTINIGRSGQVAALAGNATVAGTLGVTGDTTLASTTATTMKVGQVGTGMTRIVSGYCVTGSITIPATNASSTQTYANCTPSGGTSILASGDRVFLQATSSLPYYVVIQSASTTASGGLINVGLTNFSTSTSPSAAVYSFNFWAFQ